MNPVLAIDFGTSGAGCLLDANGRTVLAVGQWSKMTRKDGDVWRLRTLDAGVAREDEHETLEEVMRLWAAWLPKGAYTLAVEGTRAHAKTSRQSLLAIGRQQGLALGIFGGGANGPTWEPYAETWRNAMLARGMRTQAEWDALAAKMAVVAGFANLGEAYRWPHVCDALWIARYVWVERQRQQARR